MGLLSTIGAASGRAFGFTRSAIAAATDAFFNRVTLLLPGNGTNGAQNNTFLDSSSNNFTITRNGNTTQGTFSPFSQTGWSNYFGGSDALTLPSTSSLAFGTGDFCVEFWIFRTSSSAASGIFSNSAGAGGGDAQFEIQINSSLKVVLLGWNTTFMTGATNVNNNTWNHIAVVRSGTSMAMFVNGTRDATATSSNNFSSTNAFNIGRQATGASNLTGYLSNIRAVKGSSVYDPSSSSITVPTTPLTSITNTSLLTCQSNRFVDNSTNGFAVTTVGTPSVQAFSPFAPTAAYSAATVGGSGYFDGTGDYLSIADNTALDMGSSSFTMEFWTYLTGTPSTYQAYISKRANTGTYGGVELYLTSGRALNLQATLNGSSWGVDITTSSTVPLNSWTHIAVVRNGDAWAVYINGTSGASTTVSGTVPDNSSAFMIGAGAADGSHPIISGYIGGFRVVKGTAVYTAAFTPPTAPLTAITNTSLLLNFTNAGITDATAKNVLETAGNAQISTTQSKFGGSSIYFDGTTDYLVIPKRPYFDFPGDFTIEFWLYVNSLASYSFLMDTRSSVSTFWLIDLSTGGVIGWGPDATIRISSSAISTGQWYHVAISRSGSSTRMFLNGTQTGSTYTSSASITAGTTNLVIAGSALNLGTSNANVYMDDIRITTGYARYTANFTAPTAAFALQ